MRGQQPVHLVPALERQLVLVKGREQLPVPLVPGRGPTPAQPMVEQQPTRQTLAQKQVVLPVSEQRPAQLVP